MFGSNVLEVATGIIFIYLLLSLLCTVINEGIAAAIEQRGKNLLEGIKNLLNDPEFTRLAQYVYITGWPPVMQGLTDLRKANRLPSYIAPASFASALIEILGSQGAGQAAIVQMQQQLESAQKKSAAEPDDQALKKAVSEAQIALAQAKGGATDVAQKFAEAGEAAKKLKDRRDFGKTKEASEALQNALAGGRALASEYPDPLGSIQRGIEGLSSGHTKQSLLALLDKTKREMTLVSDELRTAENAVEKLRENVESWFTDAMDRFLSVLAVSLGAPFWFDTLSKFMNVRATGKIPDAGQSSSGISGK